MSDLNKDIDGTRNEKEVKTFLMMAPVFTLAIIKFIDNLEIFYEMYNKGTELHWCFVFQKIVMYLLSPLIVFSAIFKLKKWQYSSLMYPIKNRLILVGNIWFLSSLLALSFRYQELKTSIGYNLKIRDEFISSQVFVWGDLEYIILPLFIGFVFFYNNGLNFLYKLLKQIP
jgi:hypothetical protein